MMILHRNSAMSLTAGIVMVTAAIVGPMAYRALAVAVPWLWPATDGPLAFSLGAFALAATGFAGEMLMHTAYGESATLSRILAVGHRVTLAFGSLAIMTVTLLWLAVSF